MNFNAILNLRTESASQLGVVVLQFVPEQNIGAPQLTLSVAPAMAADLEVGATYRFEAIKVEDVPVPVEEAEVAE